MGTETFFYGVLLGLLIGIGFWVVSMLAYQKTLLYCARHGTAEKLSDNNFYYIVRESEYIDLLAKGLKRENPYR